MHPLGPTVGSPATGGSIREKAGLRSFRDYSVYAHLCFSGPYAVDLRERPQVPEPASNLRSLALDRSHLEAGPELDARSSPSTRN